MNRKIKCYKLFILVIYFIIIVRLFSLQIIHNNDYLEKLISRKNKIIYEDTSLRGRIYDCNNNLLVDNTVLLTIIYQKEDGLSKEDEIELAYEISNKIDLNYNKLTISYLKDFYLLRNEDVVLKRLTEQEKNLFRQDKINNKEYYLLKKSKITDKDLEIYNDMDKKAIYLYYLMNNGYSYMEKIIKENATMEEFMYFSENNYHLHGFNTKYTYGRKYLYGDTLKTILGKVGNITEENKDYYLRRGYSLNDKVGLSNIEFIYDKDLRSSKAIYLIKNKEKILLKEGERGNDIKLTINIDLQREVDDILEREVRRAKQAYNTNYYNHSYVLISDTLGGILSINGKQIIDNNIYDVSIGNITDTITAGSVVKAASMLVGYDTNVLKIGEVIKDECLKIKNSKKKCSVYTMGNINDINALAYSSNVYQFKIAIRVGKGEYAYDKALKIDNSAFDIYRDYFSRFGLGVKTGIELLNESLGYKGERKDPGLLLNFAIGQYDTYTNIQLNQYISTIAQDGKRYKMHLLMEKKDNKGNIIDKIEPILLNDINIPKEYINRVKMGLKAVTSYGSGKNYVLIDASGKTGTSESFYDSDKDGVIDKETISTNFVMYAPSINPKISISINSPNISLPSSGYKYPINQNVIRSITDNIYKYLN